MTLTGRTRYRATWRGRLVLQVEVCIATWDYFDMSHHTEWRDATLADLQELQRKDR